MPTKLSQLQFKMSNGYTEKTAGKANSGQLKLMKKDCKIVHM